MIVDPGEGHARLHGLLVARHPSLAGGLLAHDAGSPLCEAADSAVAAFLVLAAGDEAALDRGAEAVARMSFDFLRLQSRFLRTGRYACSSARETESLYGDAGRMGEYLDGLILTYALWPNQARILRLFTDHFVSRLQPGARLLEAGPGPGLMALQCLRSVPASTYTGIDVSGASLERAQALLAAGGVGSRAKLVLAGEAAAVGSADAILCCEVLEHVDDPAALLRSLRRAAADEARAYVTTVANVEAEDHVYLFSDADHIRRTLLESGWQVERDWVLPVPGFGDLSPQPVNYAALVRTGVGR